MFSFTKKKKGEEVTLKIDGMHCVSCAMSIDGALEDLKGVVESKTNYAKQTTKVVFNPDQIHLDRIKKEIESLDYLVESK